MKTILLAILCFICSTVYSQQADTIKHLAGGTIEICNDSKTDIKAFIKEVQDKMSISSTLWNKVYNSYLNRKYPLVNKEQFYCIDKTNDGFEILESEPTSNIYVFDKDGNFISSHSTD